MVPKAQVEALAKRLGELQALLNDKKEFKEKHGSCVSKTVTAQRLADLEKRHEAAIKTEREQVARYKQELEDTKFRHALEIKDIRQSVADSRKHHEDEMRKLGSQYTTASQAAAAAEKKLKDHEAAISHWKSRLDFVNDQFGKIFPESNEESRVSVRFERRKRGHDEAAEPGYTIDDYINALKYRIKPMSNFGQNLLTPCVLTHNALWHEDDCRLSAPQLALKLEGVKDRLDEWRDSTARAGADEALTFVLSWYEDIKLDGLQTLRDGSKWMDDPELVKQRKKWAHAIAQYSSCHMWTPDQCDPADKVDPYADEEIAQFASSDDEDYADSENVGEEPAEAGGAGTEVSNAGTAAIGTEATGTGAADTGATGTTDPGTAAPPA